MFVLGQAARDKLTGFEGIIVAKVHYLNGCIRCGLQAKSLENDKPIDLEYFDENQLETAEGGVDPKQFSMSNEPGGPHTNPPPF